MCADYVARVNCFKLSQNKTQVYLQDNSKCQANCLIQ